MSSTPQSRQRNPRGQGLRLRTEIISAAGRLLDGSPGVDTFTLRAVAREAGVAAPSIYAHFPDRGAIMQAVVDNGFDELVCGIRNARDAHHHPVSRLEAGVRSVLHFAWARPVRFAVMLGRPGSDDPEPSRQADGPAAISFQLLVAAIKDCIDHDLSRCADPHLAAAAIMVATHGYALGRSRRPTFPWPEEEDLVSFYVTALAQVDCTKPVFVPAIERAKPDAHH